MLDAQALQEYKSRREELLQLIDEAENANDITSMEQYQKEYNFLKKEILTATGLGGRIREASSDSERARKSVSVAIRRAFKIIEKEHNALFLHLKNTIRIGEYLSYEPEKEINWTISK